MTAGISPGIGAFLSAAQKKAALGGPTLYSGVSKGLAAIAANPAMGAQFRAAVAPRMNMRETAAAPTTAGASGWTPIAMPNIPGLANSKTAGPQVYPTGPVPLTRDQLAAFNRRQLLATQQYGQALTDQSYSNKLSAAQRTDSLAKADRSYLGNKTGAVSSLGGQGLALSPMQLNAALQSVLQQRASQRASATTLYTNSISQQAKAVADALRQKQAEEQAIKQEKIIYQTDPTKLLPGVKY